MKKPKLNLVLKELMENEGISTRELSKICKIPQSTLVAYMNGRGTQKPEHILSLAKHFKTTMEFLLFAEDERPLSLNEVLTEPLFSGWLKVNIERAIPDKHKIQIKMKEES